VKSFAICYKQEHLHSAICFITPDTPHAGDDHTAIAVQNLQQTPPLDPPGSTQKTKTTPLKSQTSHKIGGQVV
jgi:hypothetical protein